MNARLHTYTFSIVSPKLVCFSQINVFQYEGINNVNSKHYDSTKVKLTLRPKLTVII